MVSVYFKRCISLHSYHFWHSENILRYKNKLLKDNDFGETQYWR